MTLTKGQRFRIRREGSEDDWCPGIVVAVGKPQDPADPVSVYAHIDGVVRTGYGLLGGGLPLYVDYVKGEVKSLFGDRYELEVT